MVQIFRHEDSHWNPSTNLILMALGKEKGRGARYISDVFLTIVAFADENGELVATRKNLSDYIRCSPSVISLVVSKLEDVGLIEYRLHRGNTGNLYRLNPDAVCVGRKYYQQYHELENKMTGEVSKKRNITFSDNFKRLCGRYNGNQLSKKLIAAEKVLLTEWSDTVVNVIKS